MNFARKEWRWYGIWKRFDRWLFGLAAVILLTTMVGLIYLFQLQGEKKSLLKAYEDFYRRENVGDLIDEFKEFYKKREKVKASYSHTMKHHGDFFYIIVTVPEEIVLTDIECTKNRMYVAGYTPSEIPLHQYVRSLEWYHKGFSCSQKLHKEEKDGRFAFEIKGHRTKDTNVSARSDTDTESF